MPLDLVLINGSHRAGLNLNETPRIMNVAKDLEEQTYYILTCNIPENVQSPYDITDGFQLHVGKLGKLESCLSHIYDNRDKPGEISFFFYNSRRKKLVYPRDKKKHLNIKLVDLELQKEKILSPLIPEIHYRIEEIPNNQS